MHRVGPQFEDTHYNVGVAEPADPRGVFLPLPLSRRPIADVPSVPAPRHSSAAGQLAPSGPRRRSVSSPISTRSICRHHYRPLPPGPSRVGSRPRVRPPPSTTLAEKPCRKCRVLFAPRLPAHSHCATCHGLYLSDRPPSPTPLTGSCTGKVPLAGSGNEALLAAIAVLLDGAGTTGTRSGNKLSSTPGPPSKRRTPPQARTAPAPERDSTGRRDSSRRDPPALVRSFSAVARQGIARGRSPVPDSPAQAKASLFDPRRDGPEHPFHPLHVPAVVALAPRPTPASELPVSAPARRPLVEDRLLAAVNVFEAEDLLFRAHCFSEFFDACTLSLAAWDLEVDLASRAGLRVPCVVDGCRRVFTSYSARSSHLEGHASSLFSGADAARAKALEAEAAARAALVARFE